MLLTNCNGNFNRWCLIMSITCSWIKIQPLGLWVIYSVNTHTHTHTHIYIYIYIYTYIFHLPQNRKALNSLTWDIQLSLINNNLLIVQTACSLLQNFCIIWFLPLPPQSCCLRVTWDAVSWAWSPKNSHQIKHNSQLLGCEHFLSWQGQNQRVLEAGKSRGPKLAAHRL